MGQTHILAATGFKNCHLRLTNIRHGCQKTARRAVKRLPAGKPKLSRVTSGYEEHMFSLGRIRLTPKNGDFRAEAHWEKLRNSETKSLKIDPKVPNRRYRQGLQKSH